MFFTTIRRVVEKYLPFLTSGDKEVNPKERKRLETLEHVREIRERLGDYDNACGVKKAATKKVDKVRRLRKSSRSLD
jgi:hypothetical protein